MVPSEARAHLGDSLIPPLRSGGNPHVRQGDTPWTPILELIVAIYHLHVNVGRRSGGQSAAAKSRYITRSGRYSRGRLTREELVHTESGNMPKWAADDPVVYWDAVDIYERKNGVLFREVEFALPIELSRDQQIAVARRYAQEIAKMDGGNLPFTFAIHKGKGGKNPHCHLLLSERINDGIHRPKSKWFKRADKKSPKKGGAPKADIGGKKARMRAWLDHARALWADLANEALARAGIESRIDHRSYAAQGIDRAPGIHVGYAAKAMADRGIEVERVAQQRAIEAANREIDELREVVEVLNERGKRFAEDAPGAVDGAGASIAGSEGRAGETPGRAGQAFGAGGGDRPGGGPGAGDPTPDHRCADPRAGGGEPAGDAADYRLGIEDRAGGGRDSRGPGAGAAAGGAPAAGDGGHEQTMEANMVENGSRGSGGGRHRSGSGERWDSRFRKISAARRRAKEGGGMGRADQPGDAKRGRVAESDIAAARSINPVPYLQSLGYRVKRDGQRHLSVLQGRDEVYRFTRKPDGHWVWCDHYGNRGDDLIGFVREHEGCVFADAVHRLIGGPRPSSSPAGQNTPREGGRRVSAGGEIKSPRLPSKSPVHRDQGRAYLRRRGISDAVLDEAERAGFLRYCGGGVLFCGYDANGRVRAATRRAIDDDAAVRKRDLAGTDKRYSPILPGHPETVWIVEGGVDALAVHELSRIRGQEPPTVIMTGGSNVLGFLDNQRVQSILRGAERVVVAYEREKDAEIQEKTNFWHDRQVARIREIVGDGVEVVRWRPPEPAGDVAEFLERRDEIEARRVRFEDEDEDGLKSGPRSRSRSGRSGPRMG